MDNDDANFPPDLPSDVTLTYFGPETDRRPVAMTERAGGPPATIWTVSTPRGTQPEVETAPPAGAPSYRLIRIVGRGGMGEVWAAEQVSLARIVAVKKARRQGDGYASGTEGPTDTAAREFRNEALVAARVEHPNIVPVHDFGSGPDGSPLIAMKLVHGRPWNELLREDLHGMPPADLLAKHLPILLDVCNAVAFAHSRGIVHRDLKPAQVMIGDYGETLLMDWGLAICIDEAQASDRELPFGVLPSPLDASCPSGTPALMAPEQTSRSAKDIGPWTDIYLLGGTLYYLLCGTYPHEETTPGKAFLRAARGRIEDPRDRALGRDIPEELRGICLKALAANPKERHGSVLELRTEIEEFLSGSGRRRESTAIAERCELELAELIARAASLPARDVYARHGALAAQLARALQLWSGNRRATQVLGEALAHRIGVAIEQEDLLLAQTHVSELHSLGDGERFGTGALEDRLARAFAARERARRQRKILAVATAVLLLVAGGAGFVALSNRSQRLEAQLAAVNATQEKEQAERREQDQRRRRVLLERANRLVADEAALGREMTRVLPAPTVLDPKEDPNYLMLDLEAFAALERRRAEVERERAELITEEVPLPPAPMSIVLSQANGLLSQARAASRELRQAYELYRGALAADPANHDAAIGAGIAAARLGNMTSSTIHLEEATKLVEDIYGPQHERFAAVLALVASAYRHLDDTDDRFVQLYLRSLDVLHPQWEGLTRRITAVYGAIDRQESESLYARMLSEVMVRQYDPLDRSRMEAEKTFATTLFQDGRLEESEAIYKGLLARMEGLGAEFVLPRANVHLAYGALLMRTRRHEESLNHFLEALQGLRLALPDQPAELANAVDFVGQSMTHQRRYTEAIEYYREALDLRLEAYPEGHPILAKTEHNLGFVYAELGRFDEAVAMLSQSIETMLRNYGPEHAHTIGARRSLVMIFLEAKRYEPCFALALETLPFCENRFGPLDDLSIDLRYHIALSLLHLGRRDEARPYIQGLARLIEEHPDEAMARYEAVRALSNIGGEFVDDGDELIGWALQKGVELREKRLVDTEEKIQMGTISDICAQWHQHKELYDKVEPHYRRALDMRVQVYGENHDETARTVFNLGYLMFDTERWEEALELFGRAHSVWETALPIEHPNRRLCTVMTARTHHSRGAISARNGDEASANADFEAALGVLEGLPRELWDNRAKAIAADSLLRLQREAEAEPLLAELLEAKYNPRNTLDYARAVGKFPPPDSPLFATPTPTEAPAP